jgi:phosphate transport system substrate-binding protein
MAMAVPFDVVTLPGTGDSQDLLRALAQSYTTQHPERQVIVPDSISSEGGIRVVGTGESPVGRVARLPNAAEQAKYGTFHYVEFARVPVAFVVTPQAGVHDLSGRQLCAIFTGQVTNWKEVGGNDLPIDVQWRPESSNLQTIRQHIPCFTHLEVTPKAHFNLRNADLVTSMQTFAGAIGFMPLSEAMLHGYIPVTLDGVAANAPQYKLGIGLGFVYKQPLSPSMQAFLDYLKTKPAQEIMQQTGHLPSQG